MRCKHCGHKNEKNAVFCAKCGEWILAEVYRPAPASVFPKPKRHPEKGNRAKWQILVPTMAAICVLILCAGLILPGLTGPNPTGPQLQGTTSTPTPGPTQVPDSTGIPILPPETNPWILQEKATMAVSFQEYLSFIQDDSYFATEFRMGFDQGVTSLDGRCMAILSGDNELLYFRDGGCNLVAEGVTSYTLSADGSAILYTTQYGTLLFQTESMIVTPMTTSHVKQYVLSPNGRTAYLTIPDPSDPGKTLLCKFDASEPYLYTSIANDFEGYTLLAASNSGDYVYAYDENGLFCFHDDRSRLFIGPYDTQFADVYGTMFTDTPLYFSADHRQVLFYHKGKTFVCLDGKVNTHIKDGLLRMVLPQGTAQRRESTLSATLPCQDLLGKLYSQSYINSLYNIYLLQEDRTPKHFLGMTQQIWLMPNGPVYFLTEQDQIMRAPSMDQMNQMQMIAVAASGNIAVDIATDTTYVYDNKGWLSIYTVQPDLSMLNDSLPWPTASEFYIGTIYAADHNTPCVLRSDTLTWCDRWYKVYSMQIRDFRAFANGKVYLCNSLGTWCRLSGGHSIAMYFEVVTPDIDMLDS